MIKNYNHYFPTPGYLSMDSCAIDISDNSIKYGKLLATTRGLELDYYGKEMIPEGVVISGKVEKIEVLTKILKKIKDNKKFDFVRVALPEEQVYLFTIKIPKINEVSIKNSIAIQLEENIPLKVEDAVFDYGIISESDKDIHVEVVAIAKTTIDNYLLAFHQAGLIVISFELEAQAVARAIIPPDEKKPIMIVDLGYSCTSISVVENGRVFFTTTIDMGGIDLTKMIGKNFSLPMDEVEKMKRSYSLDEKTDVNEIFPVILNGLSVLRDELNKQLIYWQTHDDGVKHEKISRIIICGGGSNLAGLSDYLSTSMSINVEHANPWVNIFNMESSVPDMSFEDSLSYAMIIGIYLGGYTYESNKIINVLPEENKKRVKKEYWMRFYSTTLFFLSLIFMTATLLLFPSYLFSSTKEKLVENNLEKFNLENPEIQNKDLDKIISDINGKLELLSRSKSKYQVGMGIVGEFINNKTAGIQFSQILFNHRSDGSIVLEVHGLAVDRNALRNLKSSLEKNPNYTAVDLPISNFLEPTDINFVISITIKKYD